MGKSRKIPARLAGWVLWSLVMVTATVPVAVADDSFYNDLFASDMILNPAQHYQLQATRLGMGAGYRNFLVNNHTGTSTTTDNAVTGERELIKGVGRTLYYGLGVRANDFPLTILLKKGSDEWGGSLAEEESRYQTADPTAMSVTSSETTLDIQHDLMDIDISFGIFDNLTLGLGTHLLRLRKAGGLTGTGTSQYLVDHISLGVVYHPELLELGFMLIGRNESLRLDQPLNNSDRHAGEIVLHMRAGPEWLVTPGLVLDYVQQGKVNQDKKNYLRWALTFELHLEPVHHELRIMSDPDHFDSGSDLDHSSVASTHFANKTFLRMDLYHAWFGLTWEGGKGSATSGASVYEGDRRQLTIDLGGGISF